ncbi:hypothetical protein SFRURICE_014313 [Spodoptera frugiperda]|nr:hypothetical protein SFRURICE_014313 [Spodoptera frugiperda]
MCYATLMWMRLAYTNHIDGTHSLALVETDSVQLCLFIWKDACFGCVLWMVSLLSIQLCGVTEDLRHLLIECVRFEADRSTLFRASKLNKNDIGTFHKILREKPYQCTYCDYACRDTSTIRRHIERHLGVTKDFPCSLSLREKILYNSTSMRFILRSTPESIRNAVHKKSNRVNCEICGLEVTKNNILSHLRRHVNLRPYKCSYSDCRRRFKDKGDLKKHTLIHYPDRQYNCTYCNRRFPRKSRLNEHIAKHLRGYRVQCDYCSEMFAFKKSLSKHIKRAHGPNPKKYICDDVLCQLCKKVFSQSIGLKEHYLRHHNVKYCLLDDKQDDVQIKEEPIDEDLSDDYTRRYSFEVDIHKHEIDVSNPATHEVSEDISTSVDREHNSDDTIQEVFFGHVVQNTVPIIEIPNNIVDMKEKETVNKRIEEMLSKVRKRKEYKKTIKKCPFCGYVTNFKLSRHIKLVHKVKIRKPYYPSRIKEKITENGSKYVFQIDKDCDLEIIPSISNLNKLASMKIDEKNRNAKNQLLAKTKLVKKGGNWMVKKEAVTVNHDYLLPNFFKEEYQSLKTIGDTYIERLRGLSIIAKQRKLRMLYPCDGCEKICLTIAALKLHLRKHEINPKKYKPKIWKNRIVKASKITRGKTVNDASKSLNDASKSSNDESKSVNDTAISSTNRFADPNPVTGRHKCDKALIEFYKNNIKGGDIEFWQFLKIFNKMDRENVKDFKDLENRFDFGMHNMIINDKNNGNTPENNENTPKNDENTPRNNGIVPRSVNNENTSNKIKKNNVKKGFTRAIMISKKEYMRRMEIKKRMRERLQASK